MEWQKDHESVRWGGRIFRLQIPSTKTKVYNFFLKLKISRFLRLFFGEEDDNIVSIFTTGILKMTIQRLKSNWNLENQKNLIVIRFDGKKYFSVSHSNEMKRL